MRDFLARAEAYGIDYNIIEAFDQPWKTNEGGVGPYWGLFDSARAAKFFWTGPVSDPDHWKVAGLALLLGLLVVADHSREAAGHRRRSDHAGRRDQCGRRLVRNRVRILEGPLFRARRRLCARVWHAVADTAGADRARAHRGDRGGCVWPRSASADRRSSARHRRICSQGFGAYSGPQRAAGDAQADARCGRAARISEFRMRRRHQQHARSGLLAPDRGALPGARRTLQVHQSRQSERLQGRRATIGARKYRKRCRDRRRHRRRLHRAAGLAQGPCAVLRRPAGRR